jgi:hypothetical protein
MTPQKEKEASNVSIGEPRQADEKPVENGIPARRSASTAFGDNGDESEESPLRKKQNTIESVPDESASKNRNSAGRSRNNDVQTSVNELPRDSIVNSAADARNAPRLCNEEEEQEEELLDIVPPSITAPKESAGVKKTSNNVVAEKVVGGETKIEINQEWTCGNLETQTTDDKNDDHSPNESSNYQNDGARNWTACLGWVGIFIFLNLHVISGVIWSGILLNERATYQLESLECRERLQQAYQAMGLAEEFEEMDESVFEIIGNADDENEHQFYWQELEAQVRYWKKEAKRYQQYGDAYREQCREDLRHLLSKVEPQK